MLTKQQRRLLDFLRAEAAEERCPTFDEMAAHLGLKSKCHLGDTLDALEERGFIRRLKNRVRAIAVIDGPEYHRGFYAGMAAAYRGLGMTLTAEDVRKAWHVEKNGAA